MGLGVIRLAGQSLAVAGGRVIQSPQFPQHPSQVVGGPGVIRLEGQGLAIAGSGVIQGPRVTEHVAQVVVIDRLPGKRFDGPGDQGHGPCGVALLAGQDTQQVIGVGVIRVDLKDLLVSPGGRLRLPGLVQPNPLLKKLQQIVRGGATHARPRR